MSLLTLIQETARLCKLTVPNAVVSSTDTNTLLLLSLANESGQDLAKRYDWQELVTFSGTILATGSIDQGTITTVFGASFDRLINQTFWNVSQRFQIEGPVTAQQWQADQANAVAGPPYRFFIYGGRLKIGPTAVTAGETLTAYFVSKYWCQTSGGTGQTSFAADDDTTVIPEALFAEDIRWRFKQANGLSYAEDMETAERKIQTYMGQNTPSRVLFLGGQPVIYSANIPEGYWGQ